MKTKELEPVIYWRFLKSYGYEYGYTNRKYELLIEFISQPLELWMFIPCKLVDGEWVVLEKPYCFDEWVVITEESPISFDNDLFEEYQEAKDKVLFKGEWNYSEDDRYIGLNYVSRVDKKGISIEGIKDKIVQDILHLDLELTDKAKEQL